MENLRVEEKRDRTSHGASSRGKAATKERQSDGEMFHSVSSVLMAERQASPSEGVDLSARNFLSFRAYAFLGRPSVLNGSLCSIPKKQERNTSTRQVLYRNRAVCRLECSAKQPMHIGFEVGVLIRSQRLATSHHAPA